VRCHTVLSRTLQAPGERAKRPIPTPPKQRREPRPRSGRVLPPPKEHPLIDGQYYVDASDIQTAFREIHQAMRTRKWPRSRHPSTMGSSLLHGLLTPPARTIDFHFPPRGYDQVSMNAGERHKDRLLASLDRGPPGMSSSRDPREASRIPNTPTLPPAPRATVSKTPTLPPVQLMHRKPRCYWLPPFTRKPA